MGLTSAVAEYRASVINPLHPRDPALAELFGLDAESAAGVAVNATTAMQEETVLACVRYISETIASLPLNLMQRLTPSGRRVVDSHWLQQRLHDQPNRWQTSFDWLNLLFNWILLRGNFYVLIQPSREMPPFELLPLHPDRIQHVEEGGQRFYDYLTPQNGIKRLRYGEVFHLAFMPEDGWKGKSVIAWQRDTIGRTLATSLYGATVMRNGGRLGGILKTKKALSREAKLRLRDQWQEKQSGVQNAGRVAILDEDMDFQPVTMTNVDAQWLESMQAGVISICRIFNVPPHKVKALERATWNNIEAEQINATTDCIRPWCVRFEKGAAKDLLTLAERQSGLYVHFNLDGLLRGDFKTRQEGREIQRRNGIISGNDWAESEDMNPFPGGELRFVPLNWITLDQAGQPASTAPEVGARGQRSLAPSEERQQLLLSRLRVAHRPMIEDVLRRLARREADAIERQLRRQAQEGSLAGFFDWCGAYYDEFRGVITQAVTPAFEALAETIAIAAADLAGCEPAGLDEFVSSYAASFAARHISASRASLLALAQEEAEQIIVSARELLEGWRTERPRRSAGDEVVRLSSAASRQVWRDAGITHVRWLKAKDCEECDRLSGRVESITREFSDGIQHPPLHSGCECWLLPVGGMS